VRPKIVGRREAAPPRRGDNGAVHVPDTGRLAEATRRLLPGRAGRIVAIVAVALVAAFEASLPPGSQGSTATSTTIVLSVLAVVPLMLARRWPTFAAAASTLITVAIFRTYDAPLTVASFSVAVFLIAQLVIRRGLLFAVPLLVPFVVLAAARLDGHSSALGSTVPLLFLLGALVVGESMRRRGQAVAALDATQEAMAESIRARTVMEERARIARELHDIVAHHLSVIAVDSEVARLTSPELPSDADHRLEAIASTAREALTETRRLLGVLREDTGGDADRAPQPGLGELDDLIERARATGANVRLVREGEIARLPLSVDLAAYRIVQEALTNARRHAPGADVDVEVSRRDRTLRVRVRDHGPGTAGGVPVEGHGLMGMRERAALAGGTFSSGPADGGGFEVDVTLPTTEPAP
jgi:signal transduction histidine kinase